MRTATATLAALAAATLTACASLGPPPAEPAGAPAEASPLAVVLPLVSAQASGWAHYLLPGKNPADFRRVTDQGRPAVVVRSRQAASMLRSQIRVEPAQLGSVRFSWKVPELIADADLAVRDLADSPVRVMLAFDGDRSRFSQRDALMNELSRSLTGEELPYATLIYVWSNVRAPGTVIRSPRTDRIRKIVVESGQARLNQWLDYERDVRADFERAFGEAPGALVGVALMTDTDNTRSEARAWYGAVTLAAPVAAAD